MMMMMIIIIIIIIIIITTTTTTMTGAFFHVHGDPHKVSSLISTLAFYHPHLHVAWLRKRQYYVSIRTYRIIVK